RSEEALPVPADVITESGPIKVFDPKMAIHWRVTNVDLKD
ncbi:MAG: hypothetical protein ACI9ES_003478, partial [Oceanospirillaceae bacterium]